ncbi:MAG: tandem-95 repeat protein [Anaerolineales bacterium]|nr:tandem-95 repeat protein [Anaerolineales bacterium]
MAALEFNGSDHRLATANIASTSDQLTVMAWINPDSLDAPDRGILSKAGIFTLEIEEDGDEVAFTLINGGSFDEFEPDVPANEVLTGTWTHVAATYDGTTTTIYLNGVAIASETSSLSGLGSSTAPYYIGWNSVFGANRYFDGRLDEVAVFDRALSPSEIQLVFNNGLNSEAICTGQNQPPVAEDDMGTVPEDGTWVIDVLANDLDPDDDPLTITMVGIANNGTTSTDGSTVNYIPSLNFNGTDSFTYTINDGEGEKATATVSVTVTSVNDAPELASIGNQTITETLTLSFNAIATDFADNDLITFGLENAPSNASIGQNSGVFNWTPTEIEGPDSYSLTIVITDSGSPSLTDTETISITVTEVNQAPILANIGDKSIDQGSMLAFVVSATDADLPQNTMTYSLSGAPVGANINGVSGQFIWTPNASQQPGTYDVTIIVSDSGTPVLTDSETVQITVNAAEDPTSDYKVYIPIIVNP